MVALIIIVIITSIVVSIIYAPLTLGLVIAIKFICPTVILVASAVLFAKLREN
jgi:hypothetical protein